MDEIDQVYTWRLQAEEAMKRSGRGGMSSEDLFFSEVLRVMCFGSGNVTTYMSSSLQKVVKNCRVVSM